MPGHLPVMCLTDEALKVSESDEDQDSYDYASYT